MNLQDKVAIITGSGGGIGRGIALKFGSLGARVVVADLKLEGAKETVSLLEKAGGKGWRWVRTSPTGLRCRTWSKPQSALLESLTSW